LGRGLSKCDPLGPLDSGLFTLAVFLAAKQLRLIGASQAEGTPRRQVDAEANSFRAIEEEVKNTLAQDYLANTELSLA